MKTKAMLWSVGYGLAEFNRCDAVTLEHIKMMAINIVEEMYVLPNAKQFRQNAYDNIMLFYNNRKNENEIIARELAK